MNKKDKNPPSWLERLLTRVAIDREKETLAGDFREMYSRIAIETGVISAFLWYMLHIVKLLPAYFENSLYRGFTMSKNYIKIALRNIKRHKAVSLINISGLTVGMTAVILIYLFVQDELSYDRFHENIENLYRIESIESLVGPPTMTAMLEEFPEVQKTLRIHTTYDQERLVQYGERKFLEKKIIFVDTNFFDFFTFPLLQGNPETALRDVRSIVITQAMAAKYFGDKDPLGESLLIYDDGIPMTVTGIVENVPANSHFKFDFVIPLLMLEHVARRGKITNNYGWWDFYIYAQLEENTDAGEITDEIEKLTEGYLGEGKGLKFYARPVKDIHLTAHTRNQMEANGNILYVYILIAVAAFTLIIACFNFINLSTARSTTRLREIGMRKVVGARRYQVFGQFLAESVLTSVIACVLAVGVVYFLLPVYSSFTMKSFTFASLVHWTNLVLLISLAITVGLAAGSFPAIVFSGFKAIYMLKGNNNVSMKGSRFRKVLVVLQFSISLMLIIGTGIVSVQLDYIRTKDIGFDKEQTTVISMKNSSHVRRNIVPLRNSFLSSAKIRNVATTSGLPGGMTWGSSFRIQGLADIHYARLYVVDYEFADVLNIDFAEGRNYSEEFTEDATNAIIFNEAAIKEYGLENPIGKVVYLWGDTLEIIGVTEDFHFRSLHETIGPLGLKFGPANASYFLVKTVSGDIEETIGFLRERWTEIVPGLPFEYSFLDQEFDKVHEADRKLGTIFDYFTLLIIFIACIGLFGLASFNAVQRFREVGIRKVLGATSIGLVALLANEFVRIIVLANIVAWPTAYFLMNRWLQTFAYRADIAISTFAFSGILVFVVGIGTVMYHALKAALANPINALRHE